jgi:ketosteroid isomerase-like protein
MKHVLLLFTLIFVSVVTYAQSDEAAIQKVMTDQSDAWNRGSIDDFMRGYWQSDSLIFVGKSGPTYGYAQALQGYKKNYNGSDQMGQLTFSLLSLKRLSPDSYFVIGKWQLKRTAGDVGGIFSLLFRRIDGHWVIVVDHTS